MIMEVLPSPKELTFGGSEPALQEKPAFETPPSNQPEPEPGLVFGCRAGLAWRPFSDSA